MDINASRLIDLLEGYDFEARSYSGRGMYGKQCVGVVVERETKLLGVVAEMVAEATDDEDRDLLVGAFQRYEIDSLGRDSILYFPRVPWPEKQAAADEDEDEEPDLLGEYDNVRGAVAL